MGSKNVSVWFLNSPRRSRVCPSNPLRSLLILLLFTIFRTNCSNQNNTIRFVQGDRVSSCTNVNNDESKDIIDTCETDNWNEETSSFCANSEEQQHNSHKRTLEQQDSDSSQTINNNNLPYKEPFQSIATKNERQSTVNRKYEQQSQFDIDIHHEYNKMAGSLRTSDLPGPIVFSNWMPSSNQTVTLHVRKYVASGDSNEAHTSPATTIAQEFRYASGSVLTKQRKHQRNQTSIKTKNDTKEELTGIMASNPKIRADVTFSVVTQLMKRDEVDAVLELLRSYDQPLDEDPDTVDSMPTYEIFVNTPWLENPDPATPKIREHSDRAHRTALRQKLQAILLPIIEERITPFVHYRYPHLCNRIGNNSNNSTMDSSLANRTVSCVACYSLIRRYKYDERVSHPPHHDGHAIVTAVTSLSDYNKHYRGGLYVVSPDYITSTTITKTKNISNKKGSIKTTSTTATEKQEKNQQHSSPSYQHERIANNFRYLALNAGDTVVHTSALLHGVKVHEKLDQPELTERWSWIIWFHDNRDANNLKNCHSSSNADTWYKDCAAAGDPICQHLHARTLTKDLREAFQWTMKAAKNGASLSAVKMARAHLNPNGTLIKSDTSNSQYNTVDGNIDNDLTSTLLQFDIEKAMEYYQMAIDANNDPEAHYGIAEIVIKTITYEEQKFVVQQRQLKDEKKKRKINKKFQAWKREQLIKAVYHLELAAMAGHVLAMFNLGIAHTYGYGIYKVATNEDRTKSRSSSSYVPVVDTFVAREWFVQSGLPEGYYAASFQAASVGNHELQKTYLKRAITLGYGAPWRKVMRQNTGSGVVPNVDLNLQWPMAHDGRTPPTF